MSALQIFVSHNHRDQGFCQLLVEALRNAGADVWYDEHNLRSGPLRRTIDQELRRRQIFLLILSSAALASLWVQEETEWFYDLYRQELRRPGTASALLPVLLESVQEDDIPLFYRGFTRIAQPNGIPYPHDEAIRRTLRALGLIPLVVPPPQPAPIVQLPAPAPEPPQPEPESAAQFEQLEPESQLEPLEPEDQLEQPEAVNQPEQLEVAEPALLESEPEEDDLFLPDLSVKAETDIRASSVVQKMRRRFLISFAVNILLGVTAGGLEGFPDLSKNDFLNTAALLILLVECFVGIDFIRRVSSSCQKSVNMLYYLYIAKGGTAFT